jgi:hypothetical protein
MKRLSSSHKRHTRRHGIKMAISALSGGFFRASESKAAAAQVPDLTQDVPATAPQALTGAQFADSVSNMDRHQREDAILDQLLNGNLPSFLRKLVPIKLSYKTESRKVLAATIFVMPEYLAIGSDGDFLRIPMNLHTAIAVGDRFGFVLPTKKMVDAIYGQSTCRFTPQPLPAGPRMTSTEYYRTHNSMIDQQSQSRGFRFGALVSGHKKDVVLTNRLITHPGQIAIYGWHRAIGAPIQPLSTVHGAGYADYSHGIRLVSKMAMIDGKLRPLNDVLQDSSLARVLSDEGTIRVAAALGIA